MLLIDSWQQKTQSNHTVWILSVYKPGVQLYDVSSTSAWHEMWTHTLLQYTDNQTLHCVILYVVVNQMKSYS